MTVLTLAIVLVASGSGAFSLSGMLALAGQNFLILYGVAAGVLAALARNWQDRVLAFTVVAIVAMLLIVQGAMLLYPVALFVLACAIQAVQRLHSSGGYRNWS